SCGDQSAEVVPAASGEGEAEVEVQLLDTASAATFLAENSPTIIDVRTQEEFAAGYIAGATLIDISSPVFADAISALDRSATYFVYCRSGNRSATATSKMIELGFTSVFELDGGIVSWAAAGNDIQT
ncbi:MAG: rhodanese-like domain-containing protein, partial [Ilumatobacteraceae bacterium]